MQFRNPITAGNSILPETDLKYGEIEKRKREKNIIIMVSELLETNPHEFGLARSPCKALE
jgi:hypothetical protein